MTKRQRIGYKEEEDWKGGGEGALGLKMSL